MADSCRVFPCCLSGPRCLEMFICFRTSLRGKRRGDQNQIIILADTVVEFWRDRSCRHDVEKLLLEADDPWRCSRNRKQQLLASVSLDKKLPSIKDFNDRVVERAAKDWRVTAERCSLLVTDANEFQRSSKLQQTQAVVQQWLSRRVVH